MSRVESQDGRGRETAIYFLPTLLAIGVFALTGESASIASTPAAVAKFNVAPHTNLKRGQVVKVSGSGFVKNSTGAIVECNNTPGQPTIDVLNNEVPVSCTNPLSKLVTTSKTGKLGSTSFTIETGVIGPPANGKDSLGTSAKIAAKEFPCPPTAAQLANGVECIVRFGDASGDDVSQNIYFAAK
jgi:hypothetical protein